MKKMLYIVNLSGKRINGFMKSAILAAHEAGVDFTMASNMDMADAEEYRKDCVTYGIKTVHIDFERNPFSLKNISAYKQLSELMRKGNFDFVHCNTPIGGVLGRICAHKEKVPYVIYQAHGFHFYKGAPLKNWILYYPVEKILSRWTDVLITINQEDYVLAQKKMHAKQVTYIPGVGIDLKKFSSGMLSEEERKALRDALGVGLGDKMLLSIGELIPRKDHETAIRAVAALNDKRVKLFICGQGELEQKLQVLIDSLGLTEQVKLLGFRNDISSMCDCADLFVFPSLQEGLPVALMEAIASKLPVICSNIRGNTDLVGEESLFRCGDVAGLAVKIRKYLSVDYMPEVEKNYRNLQKYDIAAVIPDMIDLYDFGGGDDTSL